MFSSPLSCRFPLMAIDHAQSADMPVFAAVTKDAERFWAVVALSAEGEVTRGARCSGRTGPAALWIAVKAGFPEFYAEVRKAVKPHEGDTVDYQTVAAALHTCLARKAQPKPLLLAAA